MTVGPRIGLFGGFDRPALDDRLARRVLVEELAERLSGASIRTFTAGSPSAWWDGGEPLEPLGAPSEERLADLTAELDCVVVRVGPDKDDGDPAESDEAGRWSLVRELIPRLGGTNADRCPTVWLAPHSVASERLESMGAKGLVAVVPDLALLAPKVFPSALLNKRLRYLRLMSWYPPGDPVLVIQGDGAIADAATTVVGGLAKVVDAIPNLAVVIVELGGEEGRGDLTHAIEKAVGIRPYRLPAKVSLEDLTAAIAAGAAFVGHSVSASALALAFGHHPTAPEVVHAAQLSALRELGDNSVTLTQGASGLEDAVRTALTDTPPSPSGIDSAATRLSSRLADIASLASDSAAARSETKTVAAGDALTRRIAELEARLKVLEPAYEARGRRLVAERLADADVAWELRTENARLEAMQVELRAQWKESLERLEAEHEASLGAARAELEAERSAHTEASVELARLRATRTFRYTAGVRRIYGAVRRRLGESRP